MTKQISRQKLKDTTRRELLWAAWEDWTGLWEAGWQVRSLDRGLSQKEAIEVARQVLEDLLSEGLVFLCYFDDDGSRNERRMTESEASEVMRQDGSWDAPNGFMHQIRFAATEDGEAAARNQVAAEKRS